MTPYRKPNRLKEFDYSSDNLYYITTNVKNRYKCFGRIQNEIMHLNILGEIVKAQWLWLEKQYSYIKLHEFVIMPDHFHGIIEINRVLLDYPNFEVPSVGTGRDLSLQLSTFLSHHHRTYTPSLSYRLRCLAIYPHIILHIFVAFIHHDGRYTAIRV